MQIKYQMRIRTGSYLSLGVILHCVISQALYNYCINYNIVSSGLLNYLYLVVTANPKKMYKFYGNSLGKSQILQMNVISEISCSVTLLQQLVLVGLLTLLLVFILALTVHVFLSSISLSAY